MKVGDIVTSEECKQIQLDILLSIDEFCKKNDINYSIAYGTLIGAIRHRGFIPWDDDIDIIMMRDEYERFVSQYKHPKFELISGENIANHLHVVVSNPRTRLVFNNSPSDTHFYKGGVWVDVFPVDEVPKSKLVFQVQSSILLFVKNLHRLSQFTPRKALYMRCAHMVLVPFEGILNRLMFKIMKAYNDSNTGWVGDLALCYLSYPSFPAVYMKEFIDVEFEGYIFKAIKEYDRFLYGVYGDYMSLPPVEQRTPRHDYIAYWRE